MRRVLKDIEGQGMKMSVERAFHVEETVSEEVLGRRMLSLLEPSPPPKKCKTRPIKRK